MTVHVHKTVRSVGYGDHSHVLDYDVPEEKRTWTFTCTSQCEERILRDVDLTARTSAAVPQSAIEKDEDNIAERVAARGYGDLMAALKGVAKDQARERLAEQRVTV